MNELILEENKTYKQLKGERIVEVDKILTKRYHRINNIVQSIDYRKIQLEKDYLPFLFSKGAYILRNGKINHGEQIDQSIYYYEDNDFMEEIDYKKPLTILDKNEKTDNLQERVCTDILSGEYLSGLKKEDGIYLSFNNLKIPKGEYCNLLFINNHFFSSCYEADSYSYSRNPRYKTVYYEVTLDGKKITDIKYENLKDIKKEFGDKKYAYYKKGTFSEIYISTTDETKEITKKNIVQHTSSDSANFYFNDSKFYVGKNNLYELYTKKIDGIYYAVYKNFFVYYLNENIKGFKSINPIYTVSIPIPEKSYNIMFCNGEVVFKENPYHEFGIVNEQSIILKDNIYEIDKDRIYYDSNTHLLTSDKYEIIDKFHKDDKFFLVGDYFVTIKEDKICIYNKKAQQYTNNVLTNECKNFKFNRKKSCFYLNKNTNDIIIHYDTDECFILNSKEYNTQSLKTVTANTATIEDKNKNLFCVNSFGFIVPIENLENYKEFNGDNSIVGIKDSGEIYFNGITFIYKNKALYYNNKKILPNVKYRGDFKFSSLEPIDNANSEIYIGFGDNRYGIINKDLSAESLFMDNNIDCYKDNRGKYAYLIKEEIEIPLSCSLESVKKNPLFIALKNQYIIHGYHIVNPMLDKIIHFKSDIYNDIRSNIEKKLFNNKKELEKTLSSVIIDYIVKYANNYGIGINEKDIKLSNNDKDLVTIILNIKNILNNSSLPKDILIRDITKYVKDYNYDFTKDNFYISKNRKNISDFITKGISIDKFNDYEKILNFKSTTSENSLFKSTLGSSLFTQFYNLIGSRVRKIEGALQLKSLDYFKDIEDDINLSITEELDKYTDIEKSMIIKNLNKLGYKIHGLLKKYNISMDYINNNIIINNIYIDKVSLKKIIDIASDLIQTKDKLLKIINDYFNDDKFFIIKEFITKYISWSIKHIEEDFSNISTDTKNGKEKEFSIKLWDRKNLIENLVQGNKTHCCLSTDSFNIGAMIDYIYNNNIVIIEIKNKDKTIGQAFVYLAVTKNNISYRFQNKKHIFMVIDNIEINNNYAAYSNDIALHLQQFMIEYKNYISKNISDVLLGTSYNDVVPPYSFKQKIEHDSIGIKHYADNSSEFYKFI